MLTNTSLIRKEDIGTMENSTNIPKDIKEVAGELAKSFGIPLSVLFTEIKKEHRRQMIKQTREQVIKGVEGMDKLYREDKELTIITKSLECEDFYEY